MNINLMNHTLVLHNLKYYISSDNIQHFVAQMCQRHFVARFVARTSAKLIPIREARIGPTRQNTSYLNYLIMDRPDASEHTLFILLNIYIQFTNNLKSGERERERWDQ